MSFKKTALLSTLAAGAILLSSGCTSKKDVAIAAKDDTIRRQDASLRDVEAARAAADNQARMNAEQARLAAESAQKANALNAELAAQNAQGMNRQAELTKASIDQQNAAAMNISQLSARVAAMDESLKHMPAPNSVPGAEYHRDPSNGSIHIRVAGSVLFDPGRAELRAGATDTLMKAASTIRSQYPGNAIRIEGHTDSTPVVHSKDRYPDNMSLSQARAAAVYDFLAKRGGISAGRMYTAGYGDRQPLVQPERTAADRTRNRRVEIVILPTNLNVHKEQLSAAGEKAKTYRASTTSTPRVVAASATVPAPK